MYPSIWGDVTPSSVRLEGRLYVKEGTHTPPNTGFDVSWDEGVDDGSEVGFGVDGLDVGFEYGGNDVGFTVGLEVGAVVAGRSVGAVVGGDMGFIDEGFDVGNVEGVDALGCEVGEEEGFEVVGWCVGEDVGSEVPALIFVTSIVGLNVVGVLVGVRLTQPFTKRQIFPFPDSFPVDMVSEGSELHLRLNLIWIFVLFVKMARVDISQHDS
jgi:hypothetical protein